VLSEFDEAVIADIYAARERNVYGVTSEMLAESVKNGRYIKSFDEIEKYLKSISEADTLILTMGAGRMNEIAARITEG
jgi:UDP-N-acetylmuramate--alanine ligase